MQTSVDTALALTKTSLFIILPLFSNENRLKIGSPVMCFVVNVVTAWPYHVPVFLAKHTVFCSSLALLLKFVVIIDDVP